MPIIKCLLAEINLNTVMVVVWWWWCGGGGGGWWCGGFHFDPWLRTEAGLDSRQLLNPTGTNLLHGGEKSNKCNQCDFAFSLSGSSRTHLKTHSGDESNVNRLDSTPCSGCSANSLGCAAALHRAKLPLPVKERFILNLYIVYIPNLR